LYLTKGGQTHQLLVYADVNSFGESINNINKTQSNFIKLVR